MYSSYQGEDFVEMGLQKGVQSAVDELYSYYSPRVPSEDLLRHYYLNKDEEEAIQEMMKHSINDIGVYCSKV